MAVQLARTVHLIEGHLEPHEVAGYVDRSTTADERARIESHLSACAACRDEVSDAARIINTLPRRAPARRNALIAVAGIAAVLFVVLVPRASRDTGDIRHRGVTTQAGQPTIIAPSGPVAAADVFTWSAVPNATRYDVRVSDSTGSVAWTAQTSDTIARLPRDIHLLSATPYYWKVEARTTDGRSEESELVEFSVRKSPP